MLATAWQLIIKAISTLIKLWDKIPEDQKMKAYSEVARMCREYLSAKFDEAQAKKAAAK